MKRVPAFLTLATLEHREVLPGGNRGGRERLLGGWQESARSQKGTVPPACIAGRATAIPQSFKRRPEPEPT